MAPTLGGKAPFASVPLLPDHKRRQWTLIVVQGEGGGDEPIEKRHTHTRADLSYNDGCWGMSDKSEGDSVTISPGNLTVRVHRLAGDTAQ